jgi:hypothetical protein
VSRCHTFDRSRALVGPIQVADEKHGSPPFARIHNTPSKKRHGSFELCRITQHGEGNITPRLGIPDARPTVKRRSTQRRRHNPHYVKDAEEFAQSRQSPRPAERRQPEPPVPSPALWLCPSALTARGEFIGLSRLYLRTMCSRYPGRELSEFFR